MRSSVNTAAQKSFIRPLMVVFALFYLSFHAVSGERGLFAWFKETRRLEVLNKELARVSAEREELEKKVKGLSAGSLDLDLLDEQARSTLGYAGQYDLVVPLEEAAE